MKANNGKGNNESRDEWETPKWLFDILNSQYHFIIDCCASSKNTKILASLCFWSKDKPFEYCRVKLTDMAWMNPPFSRAEVMFMHFFKVVRYGVAIYRCDNFETGLWQKAIFPKATWIFIPNKRISYEGQDGSGARFPSALIGFNVEPPKGLEGTVLYPYNISEKVK